MSKEIPELLRKSLVGTAEGLRQVGKNVRLSGFADALSGYQQMRKVLLAQRLWYLREGRHDLDSQWREVIEAARDITDLLLPFCEVMQAIARMEEFQAQVPAPGVSSRPSQLLASVFDSEAYETQKHQADDSRVVRALNTGPLSKSKLAKTLEWSEAQLEASLQRLLSQRRISRRRFGKGYRFTLIA